MKHNEDSLFFCEALGCNIKKADALKLIWRHTHRDSKSSGDTRKSLLVLRSGGTCSVPLDSLTDAEIAEKLKFAVPAEARRIAAKLAKDKTARIAGRIAELNAPPKP